MLGEGGLLSILKQILLLPYFLCYFAEHNNNFCVITQFFPLSKSDRYMYLVHKTWYINKNKWKTLNTGKLLKYMK